MKPPEAAPVESTPSDLLPCPFCGSKPYRHETVNGTQMLILGCSSCGIEFKATKLHNPSGTVWSRDVEAAWNKRAEAAPVEVKGMLSAEERELTRQHALLGDPLAVNELDRSHDICERALREALASRAGWDGSVESALQGAIAERDAAIARETQGKQNYSDMCEEWHRDLEDYHAQVKAVEAEREAAMVRNQELEALLNTPEIEVFDRAVPLEAAHQVSRWTAAHDAGKNPEDWFWLVGYLAGKALSAMKSGNAEKAKHHCISTAAALRNWHSHIRSGASAMRPGIAEPEALAHQLSEQAADMKEQADKFPPDGAYL